MLLTSSCWSIYICLREMAALLLDRMLDIESLATNVGRLIARAVEVWA